MLSLRMASLVAALCWAAMPSLAPAAGDLDPEFGFGNGYVRMPLGVGEGADDRFANVIVDRAGRIVAVGARDNTTEGGSWDMVVTRLLVDGSPDPDFGVGGTATVAFDVGGNRHDFGIAVFETAEGRIVACGSVDIADGQNAVALVRLLENGARDTSFDLDGRRVLPLRYPGASADTFVHSAACAASADGRILLAGGLYNEDLTELSTLLVRFNADGSTDASFGDDGVVLFDPLSQESPAAAARRIALQPDGRILVAGPAHPGGLVLQFDMFVARLLANGSLDPSFGDAGVRAIAFDQGGDDYDMVAGLALAPDGDIVLAGVVSTAASGTDIGLVRLHADGNLDPGFGTGGRALFGLDLGGSLNDAGTDVAVDSAGRVYVAGDVDSGVADTKIAVLRVLPSGLLDTSFASGGAHVWAPPSPPVDYARATALVLDGRERVVVVGESAVDTNTLTDALVMRLTSEQLFRDGFEALP